MNGYMFAGWGWQISQTRHVIQPNSVYNLFFLNHAQTEPSITMSAAVRPQLEFYYDIVCPWAYIASTQVEALAARTGAELKCKRAEKLINREISSHRFINHILFH
jgi:hypothetical protein